MRLPAADDADAALSRGPRGCSKIICRVRAESRNQSSSGVAGPLQHGGRSPQKPCRAVADGRLGPVIVGRELHWASSRRSFAFQRAIFAKPTCKDAARPRAQDGRRATAPSATGELKLGVRRRAARGSRQRRSGRGRSRARGLAQGNMEKRNVHQAELIPRGI